MHHVAFVLTAALILTFNAPAVWAACGSPSCQSSGSSSCPTDSPFATFYGNAYPWANTMVNWSCVYSVKDFKGNNDAQFQAAAAAASTNPGGGVVYFPAGSYTFTANLTVPSNVAVRGVPTTAQAKSGKNPGPLAPKSLLHCPQGKHMGFFNADQNAQNISIVNLDLQGCAIMLWPEFDTSGFKGWFTATTIKGMGKNKAVMGCRIRDVTYQDPTQQNYVWPFSTAIAVYSDNNALVANNLLAPTTLSEKVKLTLSDSQNKSLGPLTITVDYPFDNRYGIDMNQLLMGAVVGHKCTGWGSADPNCMPWEYRYGLVIRDNYVYQNGRVGISWSGNGDGKTRGSGTVVYNNHVEVKANTTLWTVDGKNFAKGSDTNENRGYNQQGYANNITGCSGHINQQHIPCPTAANPYALCPWMSVDGEGILQQAINGGAGVLNLWTYNDLSGGATGPIWFYDVVYTQDNTIEHNTVNADQFLGVKQIKYTKESGNICQDNSKPCDHV